ncbi:MAG: 2-dehydropantoate 2-reductase [Terracidiphilus sp.]
MARIAIVGVGAIGGALAALLHSTREHDLMLCSRRSIDVLTVRSKECVVEIKARNFTEPARAEPADWVIVATKAYDSGGAAAWFPTLCAAGAPVAIVQNGIEHRERFAPYLTQDCLLPVIIDCPVERPGDGTVLVRGNTHMKVHKDPLARAYADLFEGTTAKIDFVLDFTTAAWRKLCMNSVGALSALALKPTGTLWNEPMSTVAFAIASECATVGRAEGAKLHESIAHEVMDQIRRHPADAVNSMLADRLAGRRMEIDARNGAIVRKGAQHGIPTPLNAMAVALLEAMA